MTDANMHDHSLTIVAAAALIRDDGAILMQRRPEASQHGGLWEFPGGKREAGETLRQCLVRELEEELHIQVAPATLHHCASTLVAHGAGELLLVLFIAWHWRGRPVATGGAALAWIQPDRLHELAMPPADIPLARALAISSRLDPLPP